MRRRSAISSGCARRTRTSAAAASRTTARSRRASAWPAFPRCAETIALATILALVRDTGVRVHMCRLSSRGKRGARARGQERRPAGHVRRRDPPSAPVRRRHRLVRLATRGSCRRCARRAIARRLRAGLADGTIDVVCSDHAPVDDDGKQVPFGEAEPGATGLELLLPLTLKWASEEGVPLATALAKHDERAGARHGHRRRHARGGRACRRVRLRSGAHGGKSSARRCAARARTRLSSGIEVPGQVRCTHRRGACRPRDEPLNGETAA